MIRRRTFPVGMLQCNCSVLVDDDSAEAVVIDPGDDIDQILAVLQDEKARVVAIVHTHAHVDHIGATAQLAAATGAPTYLHDGDKFLHDILATQAQLIGVPVPEQGPIDAALRDEGCIQFGNHELGVIHTPGHTPGSVCFGVAGHDLCFTGDTLFAGGIGRTDLWGGDPVAIEKSIKNRLYNLNGAVAVVPGHGPETSIDKERVSNPFVRAG